MKERPILFSAPMVRAILEGRKTQTRRIVKPQPELCCNGKGMQWNSHKPKSKASGAWATNYIPDSDEMQMMAADCPYGKPGDRLWVRETWTTAWHHAQPDYLYRADHEQSSSLLCGWKSSIHMPRAASRITLEITEVRVQRLQDISAEDVVAEGLPDVRPIANDVPGVTPHSLFSELWESINGKGSWNANPYVWAISFIRI